MRGHPTPGRRGMLRLLGALPGAAALRGAGGAVLPLIARASTANSQRPRTASCERDGKGGGECQVTAVPRRIAVLDWDLTEMVLSLDVTPVGVSRPKWYMLVDGQPALPAEAADLGLLFQPNFEELQRIAPDLIVVTPAHAPLRPMLERIAPTLTLSAFRPGIDAYEGARQVTRELATTLGRSAEADVLLRRTDSLIADVSARIQRGDPPSARAMLVLRPIDGRHVTVFGAHSLFGGVLQQLGIANAWQRAVDLQGFAQTDLASLGALPDARVVMVGATPPVLAEFARSPLWNALPFVEAGRVQRIDAVPPTGGMFAAMRFATQIGNAMTGASS